MRRSIALLRGSKGYSWYNKYKEGGDNAFLKYVPPTPFAWPKLETGPRPRAFFDIKIDAEETGRLVFELASDIVPKTVTNFANLCEGKGLKFKKGYKNTKIHHILKGVFVMGGDIETENGTGNHSSFEHRHFSDENFIIPHSSRGLMCMASSGIHTNGSQFYISLGDTSYMNGRCVVFGRLVQGDDVLTAIEKVFTFRGTPARQISIADCGFIEKPQEDINPDKNKKDKK